MEIELYQRVLAANDIVADENREILNRRRLLTVNIIGSPGAGKTSLICQTLAGLRVPCAVIEGDIASDFDARKIAALGVPVIQINTGGSCHLNAVSVAAALDKLALEDGILLVENVGNLICPASFDLGEDFKVVVASVAEGGDKPYKYPAVFQQAKAVVINKIDLLAQVDFDRDFFQAGVRALNPQAVIFPLSCKTGVGIGGWSTWLQEQWQTKFRKLFS
jgi:hydrogenase nickel incorporation protein HypB